ncbi:MAG: GTPase [Maribacter sp.]|nr:GTPase [Maribacter sp.]MBT8299964.1 GTPase [Maribacter sp.]
MQEKLIFVYNADSGLGNILIDGAHKIFSPSTYECKLCEITYGAFTENRIWKKFREASSMTMEFLYKDEFKNLYASKFGYKFDFPIVLVGADTTFDVFVSTAELNAMENVEELINLINSRI